MLRALLATTLLLVSAAGAAVTGEGDGTDELRLDGRQAVEHREIAGYTRASRLVLLAAETSGRLLDLGVPEGGVVPAGTDGAAPILARQDDARLRLSLEAEKVALAEAETEAEFQEGERKRIDGLGDLSPMEQRTARRHAARRAVLAVEAARVRLRLAEDALSRTVVHAEPGLTVLEHRAQPGEFLQPGAPIALLGDYRVLEVDLRLSEEEIFALRREEAPSVACTDPSTTSITSTPARLAVTLLDYRIGPEFDPATRKRRVELRLDPASLPEASGGLRVWLSLTVPDASGAWSIPKAYVSENYEETFVLTGDGRVPVTVLRRDPEGVILLGSGLSRETVLLLPK